MLSNHFMTPGNQFVVYLTKRKMKASTKLSEYPLKIEQTNSLLGLLQSHNIQIH